MTRPIASGVVLAAALWTAAAAANGPSVPTGLTTGSGAGTPAAAAGPAAAPPAAAPAETAPAAAQARRVETQLEPPAAPLSVGDPVTVVLRLREPAGARLDPTSLEPEAFRPFALLGVEQKEDGALALRLAPADTGKLEIPSVSVGFRDRDGRLGQAATTAVPVEVASVLGEGAADLADIRPPADVRPDWLALAPLGALVVLILAAIAAAIWWWRRRVPVARPQPGLEGLGEEDPWAWVRGALEALLRSSLLERNEMKVYCVRLSEIAREYLERRYRIPALERTTAEIHEELERAFLDAEVRRTLTRVLWSCDAVKFAGNRMTPEEARALAADLGACLEKTKPVALPEAQARARSA